MRVDVNVRYMKRILFILIAVWVFAAAQAGARDPATEERLNRLSGQIEDLIVAQRGYQEQFASLAREIQHLRDQLSRPNASYLTRDDLRPLSAAIEEVDRKRIEDAKKIQAELVNLAKALSKPEPRKTPVTPRTNPGSSTPEKTDEIKPDEKGFEYTIEKGDTISTIVAAYREKGIKVSTEQILKANKGLQADRMPVGKKIWIPAPEAK